MQSAAAKARRIVRKVLTDLLDRRGFRQAWDSCVQGIKTEIRTALVEIVARELTSKDRP